MNRPRHRGRARVVVAVALFSTGALFAAHGRTPASAPEKLHLGTFAFDPLGVDPAATLAATGGFEADRTDDDGDDYVVQSAEPIRQAWLDALAAAGAEPVQYVPRRGYLVHARPEAIERVRRLDQVRAVVRYQPAHKLPAELLWVVGAESRKGFAAFGHGGPALYDLAVAKRAGRAPIEAAVGAAGGRLLARLVLPSNYFDLLRVELPPAAVAALAARPGVIRIDPYVPPEPEDERAAQIVAGNYTNATTIDAPGYDPAAQFGVDGDGVTVAIVDDGVGIPGDGGFYVTSGNAVNGPLRGAAAGADGHGHLNATIVAGTTPFGVLDAGGYNYGLGVATGAHVVNIPLLRTGYAGTDADTANDAITTTGPNGVVATISNNSWGNGTNGNAYDSLAAAYDGFALDASTAGTIDPLLFVFSAGNSGTAGLTRPKVAKNLLAVAASENLRSTLATSSGSTGAADNLEQIPDFSSRGLAADGRIKPDITAPGAAITGGRSGTDVLFGNIDAAHRHSTGTSHAAPQVAGAAALFVEQWKAAHFGAQPSPAMVKAALINGAVEVTGAGATAAVPNGDEGWGRVHLANSLDPALAREAYDGPLRLDDPGDLFAETFAVDSGSLAVRVTLVWSDPPGVGDPALVNDLDLELVAEGAIYRGNVFVSGDSVAGGAANTVDNVESVRLPAGLLAAGTPFAVRVVASELNGNGALGEGDATDQRFALVVSNAAETTAAVLAVELLPPTSESCTPANALPDPGEYVTTSLCLENYGNAATTNLGAFLGSSTDVEPVNGVQSYGALPPDSFACRDFQFLVSPAHDCGNPVVLVFSLDDDGDDLGDRASELDTGVLVPGAPQTFTQPTDLSIPELGAASIYPSQLAIAATGDVVVEAELLLDNLSHTFPSDVDIRLVSPSGTAATLFSDVGGGGNITNRDFTLDDDAASNLGTGTLAAGTYKPTDLVAGDAMPASAPAANAATAMSSFDGVDPDGTWELFVADDSGGDSGSLGGWSLRLTLGTSVCSGTCPLIFADGFETGGTGRWSP